MNSIQLTQTVQKGGCAAKVPALELRKILSSVKFPPNDANVLVDGGLFDDAAIYKVDNNLALVQTLDFFTPIVDSPFTFGAIAATNALGDVYAMGGVPKTAMAILAFPSSVLSNEIIVQVIQGASDKIKEAGANFVGGHSIDDDTLKFGLSVSGYVHPEKIWSNNGCKDKDVLILTKPIGTGALTAALKRQIIKEEDIQDVLESMMQLNDIIKLLDETDLKSIHAATDITGFGLAGHALQMAKASQKKIKINIERIPFFNRTIEFIEQKVLTKAHRTNGEYVDNFVEYVNISDTLRLLTLDPQTSGGLLLSVDANHAKILLQKINKKFTQASEIGVVESNSNVNFKWISFE